MKTKMPKHILHPSQGLSLVWLVFLLAGFIILAKTSYAEVSNIEGVYIERSSNASTKISSASNSESEPYLLSETAIEDGDIIAFDIPGFQSYLDEHGKTLRDVTWILENIELKEFPAIIENTESDVVRFLYLKGDLTSENQMLLYKLPGRSEKKALIGIKLDESETLFFGNPARIHFKEFEHRGIICISFVALLLLSFLFVVYKYGSIIKDNLYTNLELDEELKKRTENFCFSFSKSQFLFWTLIVLISFIYIWIMSGDLKSINQTALVLLGITTATISVSNLISINEEKMVEGKNEVSSIVNFRTKNKKKDSGFLTDILSDKNGISAHRLQAVVFNLIFGIAFLQNVLTNFSMPDFSAEQFILLGLSSGTYAFMKSNEVKFTDKKP